MKELEETLEGIRDAKPREWAEMADQFEPWAKNRARHVLARRAKEGE